MGKEPMNRGHSDPLYSWWPPCLAEITIQQPTMEPKVVLLGTVLVCNAFKCLQKRLKLFFL